MKTRTFKTDVDALAAGRRAEAIQLTDAIRDDLAEITRHFYDVGEKLRRVIDEKLYVALAYASFRDYLAGELSVAATQAFKMIRVVRAFARSDAGKLGLDRAAMLISYARAVGHDDPGVLVREDVQIGEHPASVATRDEIAQAIRGVREARVARRARSPQAMRLAREAKAITKRLHALVREQGLGRATVAVHDDEVVIRLARSRAARWTGGGDG